MRRSVVLQDSYNMTREATMPTMLMLVAGILIAQPRVCRGQVVPAVRQRNIATGEYTAHDGVGIPGIRLAGNTGSGPTSGSSSESLDLMSLDGAFNFGTLEEPNGTEAPPLEVEHMFQAVADVSESNSTIKEGTHSSTAIQQNHSSSNSTTSSSSFSTASSEGKAEAELSSTAEAPEAAVERKNSRRTGKVSMSIPPIYLTSPAMYTLTLNATQSACVVQQVHNFNYE